jgi:hypothetical protein
MNFNITGNTQESLAEKRMAYAQRNNLIVTVCMYCNEQLSEKKPEGGQPGVSHGLCEPCFEEKYAEEQ